MTTETKPENSDAQLDGKLWSALRSLLLDAAHAARGPVVELIPYLDAAANLGVTKAKELLCPAAELKGRREALADVVRQVEALERERAPFETPPASSVAAWARSQLAACGPGAKVARRPSLEEIRAEVSRPPRMTDFVEAKAEAKPDEQPAPALAVEPLSEAEAVKIAMKGRREALQELLAPFAEKRARADGYVKTAWREAERMLSDQLAACGPGAKAQAAPLSKFEQLKRDVERHQRDREVCPTCGAPDAKVEAKAAEIEALRNTLNHTRIDFVPKPSPQSPPAEAPMPRLEAELWSDHEGDGSFSRGELAVIAAARADLAEASEQDRKRIAELELALGQEKTARNCLAGELATTRKERDGARIDQPAGKPSAKG